MLKNFKIVLAQEKDTDEILNLYRANLYGPADWDENYPSLDTIAFDLSRNSLYVMRNENNEIISAISIDSDEEVENLSCWNKDLTPAIEISRLCVREDMTNNGISKVMMKHLFTKAKNDGCKSIHILVKTGHTVALKSYSKLGFKKVSQCNLFGKDFICMEKAL